MVSAWWFIRSGPGLGVQLYIILILVNFRILFNLVLGGFRDFKDEAFKEGLGCPVPASKFRKLRIRSQTYPN